MNETTDLGISPEQLEPWMRPHIDAIRVSLRTGFRFRHLPGFGEVFAVQGFRVWSAAMDVYIARAADDAIAARFRLTDLDTGDPPSVWHRRGSVADVVGGLLELPAHGTGSAPRSPGKRVSGLWSST